jgi:hypothetical protein
MRRPGVRIPLPPVFARNVVESEDCRAVALAKADPFRIATSMQRATTRRASLAAHRARFHLAQSLWFFFDYAVPEWIGEGRNLINIVTG